MNTEILEQILLEIDKNRFHLFDEQLDNAYDDERPVITEMLRIYTRCIPNELYIETCELFDFSDFDEDEKLLHLFGKDGLAEIRNAQKAAITKAKKERTELLVF